MRRRPVFDNVAPGTALTVGQRVPCAPGEYVWQRDGFTFNESGEYRESRHERRKLWRL